MENNSQQEVSWLKIDNAGLIYPSASSETWNNVFRVSAYLNDDVDAVVLQQALDTVILRYPHLNVSMRRGFFWYYFQTIEQKPKVAVEKDYPCRRMELNSKQHLFRVLYYKNKVSFETFHSLTDGTGAICFLNTLLGCYFNLLGKNITEKDLVINYKDKPSPEEIEDSFRRVADKSGTATRRSKKAYQVYGTPEPNGKLDVITLTLDAEKLHSVSRKYDATITQFLVAAYAKAILNYQQFTIQKHRPVVISVPINLRKYYDTKTLRNFSSWIDIEYNAKNTENELSDLISLTKTQMAGITKEYLQKNINTNVKTEKNFFVRIMPLIFKKMALQLSYKLFGENSYTTVLTNLGKISAPKEFESLVDRYECLLCKSIINGINVGVASFKNKITITFTSPIKEHLIERDFCRILKKFGLDIEVNTNII